MSFSERLLKLRWRAQRVNYEKLETAKQQRQKQPSEAAHRTSAPQSSSLLTLTNLSLCDEEFVHNVKCDIERYLKKNRINSVLLLPPVNNYRRFLIHQTCESFSQQYDLHTFSIGQGPFRRTVICFKTQLLDPIKYNAAVANSSELRKQTQVKSWRSERKPENSNLPTFINTNCKKNLNFPTNMGVERNESIESATSSTTRCVKPISAGLYRPPALRLHSNELSGSSPQKFDTKNEMHAKVNNSISCFNSPTHANENNKMCNIMTLPDISDTEKSQQPATTATTTTGATANPSRRERRPDRAVYIPRARRSQTTPPATTAAQSQQTTNSHVSVQQLAFSSDLSCSVSTAPSPKVDELIKNCPSSKKIKSTSAVTGNKERKERTKKLSTSSKHKTTAKVITSSISEEERKLVKSIDKDTNCDSLNYKSNEENNADLNSTNNKHKANNISQSISTDISFKGQKLETLKNNTFSAVEMATSLEENRSNLKADSKIDMSLIRIEDVIAVHRIKPKCDIEAQELQRASKEINRSNRRIMKQSFVSDVLEIPEKIEKHQDSKISKEHLNKGGITSDEEEEDDWENLYDENGECLDPKILQELTASVGKVKIELPKMDYSAYLSKQSILNDEEFPHVLEVSNFPVEFKNQDLLMVFSQYKESGFDIKWVDDTHALAVFSSSRIAAEVLTMGHPFVVLKPLAEATVESRLKAKKCSASLQPYRPRPETCAALARRLVTGALGVRLKTAAAERENEKRVLREAKERKLLAAKQRDEAWES